ncbi:hypothetical protein LXL04_003945 [Taraxacum kok-saghyz]
MDDAKIVGYKTKSNKDYESSNEDRLLEILAKPRGGVLFPSTIKNLQISDFCTQKLFLEQIKSRIPKQMMSVEEKYLRHCLELIHTRVPDRLKFNPITINESSGCDALFLFSSTSSADPIVGSITGSTSMINLLNSPLLCPPEVKQSSTFSHHPSSSSSSSSLSSSSSSSSSSNSYSQGMLHCSWNNGFPHYVFSVEDQKEVYTTNLSKVESIKDEGLDYVYMFHDHDSDLVAKMKVSTSFTFCPLGTQIIETQFILCATNEGPTSNPTAKKTKALSKKMTDIFRNRNRTCSKIDETFAIEEGDSNVSPELSFPCNLETVAIVVKDHVKKVEAAGWGLKFLKEGGGGDLVGCQVCGRNSKHCSSMDVIVPAGIHGGPKVKNGGPCSLVERWRNGGSCDCGGWDIGCPITVLNAGLNNKDGLYQAGVFGKSNSFELFTQGCKQSPPVIEVTNIHDGLYYIHFQSTLSALQSLSIAVAIIHSHSPTLKPKVYTI